MITSRAGLRDPSARIQIVGALDMEAAVAAQSRELGRGMAGFRLGHTSCATHVNCVLQAAGVPVKQSLLRTPNGHHLSHLEAILDSLIENGISYFP